MIGHSLGRRATVFLSMWYCSVHVNTCNGALLIHCRTLCPHLCPQVQNLGGRHKGAHGLATQPPNVLPPIFALAFFWGGGGFCVPSLHDTWLTNDLDNSKKIPLIRYVHFTGQRSALHYGELALMWCQHDCMRAQSVHNLTTTPGFANPCFMCFLALGPSNSGTWMRPFPCPGAGPVATV